MNYDQKTIQDWLGGLPAALRGTRTEDGKVTTPTHVRGPGHEDFTVSAPRSVPDGQQPWTEVHVRSRDRMLVEVAPGVAIEASSVRVYPLPPEHVSSAEAPEPAVTTGVPPAEDLTEFEPEPRPEAFRQTERPEQSDDESATDGGEA